MVPGRHEGAAERLRGRLPAEVGDQLLKRHDADVAVADRRRDPVHRLIGRLHVVAPQRHRRAQQGDIRRRDRPELELLIVAPLDGQLPAATPRDEHRARYDDDDDDPYKNRHL
jgi:hypothetical protein